MKTKSQKSTQKNSAWKRIQLLQERRRILGKTAENFWEIATKNPPKIWSENDRDTGNLFNWHQTHLTKKMSKRLKFDREILVELHKEIWEEIEDILKEFFGGDWENLEKYEIKNGQRKPPP